MNGKIYKYISAAIVLLVFVFIFRAIRAQWSQIIAYPLHIDYLQLALSFVGLWMVYILSGVFWTQILNRFQRRLTFLQGLSVWMYSQLGKYLPGRGLIYLGRLYLCQKYGVDNKNSLASGVLEFGLNMLSGLILVLIALPFMGNLPVFISGWWVSLFILFSLLMIHPKVFLFIVNRLFLLFRKEKIELKMTYGRMLVYLFMYLVIQFLAGISFYFFARVFYPVAAKDAAFVAVSFIIAYIVGVLGFLAPAGLGIREGILLIFLNNVMPAVVVIQIALFSRLWTVFGDLTGAAAVFGLARIYKIK